MCGIAGRIDFADSPEPTTVELMQQMAAAIRHRGPDEFGAYRDPHAALLSSRLSVIDVPTGQQPMSNEDQTLWVVFNGEIFNFVELRKELEDAGHRFRTRSDTEIIPHAFEEWNLDCFRRFNGQWAIALWDEKRKALILCRDRVGVRPLFICRRGQQLWFASEVKALLADPRVPRGIDPQGINQTFTYWSPIAPQTVFEGIEEIVPGSYRVFDASPNVREEIYWRPNFPSRDQHDWKRPFPLSIHEAAEELRTRLRLATKLRVLRADVPVGSYLSGGLDSSIIARLGRDAKDGDFRTYSVRFEDAEFDETPYQRLMASEIHSDHEELLVTKRDIVSVFPDVVWHAERPLLRTAPAPLFLLSRVVRESGTKAVLTGEGADEMLAGYDLFREAKVRLFWSNQRDSTVRPRLFSRLYPYLARSPQQTRAIALEFWKRGLGNTNAPDYSHQPRWVATAALKRFFSRDLKARLGKSPGEDVLATLPPGFNDWDPLAQAQYLEIYTLFAGYIISSQGDRMLMAHSVEGRFPFLDADVMEFCHSLPADYKLRFLNEKFVLKVMAHGSIPEEIIARPKQPYRAPDALSFFADRTAEYVQESFSQSQIRKTGIFDPALASALFEKCRRAITGGGNLSLLSNSDNMAFVGILSTQLLNAQLVEDGRSRAFGNVQFKVFVDRIPERNTKIDGRRYATSRRLG
jgi:asparagine synthase (glutamine-hydrolysing)